MGYGSPSPARPKTAPGNPFGDMGPGGSPGGFSAMFGGSLPPTLPLQGGKTPKKGQSQIKEIQKRIDNDTPRCATASPASRLAQEVRKKHDKVVTCEEEKAAKLNPTLHHRTVALPETLKPRH